jgi:succinate dehydrogenase / fumarate reductase cytochrome b subunit
MAGIRKPSPVKNLYLPGIRLPVGGVVSILHRVSGVLMVLLLPASLWMLQQSLASPESYSELLQFFARPGGRIVLLCLLLAGVHHLLAGVRHLLLDIDIGISRSGGRRGAWLVVIGVAIVALVAAGCLFK